MKYGLELQDNVFPPWRLSYVAYDILKQELKTRQLDHGWTQKDETDFVHLLDNELSKVYDFINAKLAEIDARILYCERTIQTLQKNPTMNSDANYSIMDEALTDILFDVNDLSKFTRVNFTAIQKILKKHDRWTGLDLKQTYVTKLREKPLDKQRFDVAIVYISALHDICRNRGQQSPGDTSAGGDQNAFERATAKYWIHPDNITEVKAIIMLHLPVLIFNTAKKFEASDSAVSSIYFDNPNFDLYTGRLQRDEMAEAIRFRWYGPFSSKNVFIERKTHHAVWLDGASVKDRFRINEDQVNAFVSGEYTADQIANELRKKGTDENSIRDTHFIGSGIQTSFREKHLEPVLRVFYNRTAFQLPDSQRVRISLDTDLTFIREDHLDGVQRRNNPPNNWRRTDVGIDNPFPYLKEHEILRFPYAILETKLQTHLGQEAPKWLTSLVESHLVHEVPRFSKYLHGACHFFRDRLPLLPWWLSEMNVDIRKPRNENIGLTRSRSFKPLIDGRYRRAMIEEKERVNKEAVMNKENEIPAVPPLNREKIAQQLNRRCSASIDEKTAAAWKPTVNNPGTGGKEEFTLIELNNYSKVSTSNKNLPSFAQPLLSNENKLGNNRSHDSSFMVSIDDPFKSNNTSSKNLSPPPPVTKFYSVPGESINGSTGRLMPPNEIVFKKQLGAPVEAIDLESGDLENNNNKRARVKVKVEPKTFFANERTFIAWLQFCALLLTVALNLLNFGDNVSRIVGGVFIGLSAAVSIYALYRFEKRAWMINRRDDGRYDDIWGPAVLCVLLVTALIINFYLRFDFQKSKIVRVNNSNNNSRNSTFIDEPVVNDSIYGISFLLRYILDVIMGSLIVLKPIVSLFTAITILFGVISFGYQKCQDLVLDTICPMPFIGNNLPLCQHYIQSVPDFTHLVKLQETLYDGMLSQTNADSASISALELKRVELATRDLQAMIKYSNLQSHDLLEAKLGDYIFRSRRFGRDIQSLQAQTKGVIDNLITYNTFTLRKLSEVEAKKTSRQELRTIYEHAMTLVEKEAKRLILAIEKALGSLDLLEEDLYAIHEISIQEKTYQQSEKPHILADLVNRVRGKGLRRSLVNENLDLLVNFDAERSKAAQQLMVMLDRMEAFQMDLEELRSQVVAPILIPDALPLEMHIENVGKAIERLKNGKVISWEEKQQIEGTGASTSAAV
ncbi:MAG: VTC domain-containing protein [Benjaminiella poitrasii]|nr:MAG: VTC domain-containing protein [Benjaminiella poitrasii]